MFLESYQGKAICGSTRSLWEAIVWSCGSAAGFMVEIPRCWKFKRCEISDRESLHNKKQSKKEMKAVGRNAGGLKWSKSFDTRHGFTACPPGFWFFCVSEFHNYGSIFPLEMVLYIYHYMLELYNRSWFDFNFIITNYNFIFDHN